MRTGPPTQESSSNGALPSTSMSIRYRSVAQRVVVLAVGRSGDRRRRSPAQDGHRSLVPAQPHPLGQHQSERFAGEAGQRVGDRAGHHAARVGPGRRDGW